MTAVHKANFGMRACIRSNMGLFNKRTIQTKLIIWNENAKDYITTGEFWSELRVRDADGSWSAASPIKGGYERNFDVKQHTTQSVSSFSLPSAPHNTCFRVVAKIRVNRSVPPSSWSYFSRSETCQNVSGED